MAAGHERGVGEHPWYRGGRPAAVGALIQRYRREASEDRAGRERAALLYEIGRLFEEHLGDAGQAVVHFREAVEADGTFVPVLRALRRHVMGRGAAAEVLDLLDREIAATPEGPARAGLLRERGGVLERDLGRADEARAAYVEALRVDPSDGMAARALAVAARRARDWPALREALTCEAARTVSPDARRAVLLELARLNEMVLGDLDAAEAGYREAARLEGGVTEAREALERIAWKAGRWADLVAMLAEDAAAIDGPARADLLYQIARISVDRLGDRHRARVALEEARTIRPDSQLVLRELLRVYEGVGAWHEAATTLRALVALTSGDRQKVQLIHRLGQMLHERLGRTDDAIDAWRQGLALNGAFGPTLQAAGDVLARAKRWDDLLEMHLAEAAAQENVDRKAMALFRAGELLERRLGRVEEAARRFEAAAATAPSFVPALRALETMHRRAGRHRDLADLYGRLAEAAADVSVRVGHLERRAAVLERDAGDVDGAVATLEAILDLVPDHVGAVAALCRIREDRCEWDKLIDLLRRLAEKDSTPEGSAAHLMRIGEIYEREIGDAKRALVEYQGALAADPRHLPAMRAAGRIIHMEKRWDDLVALYRREIEVTDSPSARAAILHRIGVICEEQIGAVDRAARAFHEAFQLDRSYAPVIQALVRIHLDHRDLASVVHLLEAEAELYPDPGQRAAALHRIGEIWEDPLGRIDAALDCYLRALEMDPDLGPARAARDRLLAGKGAWGLLAEALGAPGREPADHDEAYRAAMALGIVWKDNIGDPVRAAAHFRRARELRPDAVEALRALAEVHAAAGEREALTAVLDRLAAVLPGDGIRIGYLRERLLEAEKADESAPARARLVDEIRRLAPGDPEMALMREGLAVAQGDAAAMENVLGADVERAGDGGRAVALYRLADWRARRGDLAAAADAARMAVEADLSSMPAVVLWTSLVEASGGRLEAEHLVRLAGVSSHAGVRAEYLIHAAEILAADPDGKGRDEIASLLADMLRASPGAVDVMAALVRLHGARSDWDRLARTLRDVALAARDLPEAAEVLYMLAAIQRDRLGERREAISTLNRILRVTPDHVPALTDLADMYAEEDLFNEAINIYRHLLRTDADETTAAEAAVRLATLLEDKLQDVAAAREVLDRARERYPDAPALLERLALQHKREQRWADARRTIEGILVRQDLGPRRVGYMVLLADVLLEGFSDGDGAAALLRSAAEEETGSTRALGRLVAVLSERREWKPLADLLDRRVAAAGATHDRSLATLLVELAKVRSQHLGDNDGAIDALVRAVAIDPWNRAARLRLAEIQARDGRSARAAELARALLAEDPTDKGAYRV
ncbi:MAG: tetratricopeptide repeat protein, partial [Myxococcota bacterium]|nr:tetratricopeptide repeat protein [Myxococcota bacterium]